MKKNLTISTTTIIIIITFLLVAAVLVFALVYNKKFSKINKLDANTNTSYQNKQNSGAALTNTKDNLPSQNPSASSSALTTTNQAKPNLAISALKAPSNVDIDFICYGRQGDFCFVTLTNTSTGEKIVTSKTEIKADNRSVEAANIIWKTKTGIWRVFATVTADKSKTVDSDASMLEIYK